MKKRLVLLFSIICLLLSSCGDNKAQESFESFCEKLRGSEKLSFEASLRSEYDDKTVGFSVRYASDEEGCSITVTEPELISGISAHIEKGGSELRFDDMILDTGKLTDFGLTPMSALPMLIDGVKNGYTDSVWEENGELAAHIEAADELSLQLRLDKYSLTPVSAELISDEQVKVFVSITNWNMKYEE